MAAAPLPTVIILALGAVALGGPDALRVLLEFTGQSPGLDIAISMFLMFMVTAYLLGTVLLVRFVRDARPRVAAGAGGGFQGHGSAATHCLAQLSLLVSACVAFLVAVCLVALPPSVLSAGLGTLSFITSFSGKNNSIAIVVIAATAAATSVRCTSTVLCFVRGAGHAGGDGASGARFSRTRQTVCFIFIALLLAAVSSAAFGGVDLDAERIFPGFPFPTATPTTNVPVGLAIATVAGTALVIRFSRSVRNAAGAAAAMTGLPRVRGAGASAS